MSKDVERITQINDQGERLSAASLPLSALNKKSAFQRHFTMNQDALRILAKELTGSNSRS